MALFGDAGPEDVLRDYLSGRMGDFHLQSMDLGVDGWTVFRGDDRTVHDGGRGYWVVRDDGTVVEGTYNPLSAGEAILEETDARAELRRIFADLAVLDEQVADNDFLDQAVAEGRTLGQIALALNGGDVVFVNHMLAERLREDGYDRIAVPRWERRDDGTGRLTYSVKSSGRGLRFWTFTVDVATDYTLAVERESFQR